VILAMGRSERLANSFLRFSMGRETSSAEIDRVLELFPAVVARLREQQI
jgi:cysteine desulfurase